MKTVTEQIAEISEILGTDAIAFVKIRFALESIEQENRDGDPAAAEILQVVDKFHLLVTGLAKLELTA